MDGESSTNNILVIHLYFEGFGNLRKLYKVSFAAAQMFMLSIASKRHIKKQST